MNHHQLNPFICPSVMPQHFPCCSSLQQLVQPNCFQSVPSQTSWFPYSATNLQLPRPSQQQYQIMYPQQFMMQQQVLPNQGQHIPQPIPQQQQLIQPPVSLMSLQIPLPEQLHRQKQDDAMKLAVYINKRKYVATVRKERNATSINCSVANYVVRGIAPLNDTINVPFEINGKRLSISCIVGNQTEKIVIGRQCLQAFGLRAGVIPKPSVHQRLGNKITKKKNGKGNKSNGGRRNNDGNNRSTGVYRTLNSRPDELRNILYPGGNDNINQLEFLQVDVSNEDREFH